MVIFEVKNIKKQYMNEPLFSQVSFQVHTGDRIGIVGKNGCGKTTLLRILAGVDTDYQGEVRVFDTISYMPQLGFDEESTLSGGEHTKNKIYSALRQGAGIILLDEPTSNLDLTSIKHLERQLERVKSLIIVSHDERLLQRVCNKVLHIDGNTAKIHAMSYEDFKEKITGEREGAYDAYEKYLKEKKKLEKSISKNEKNARKIKKAPGRMGNSEARLHKRKAFERRAKVEKRSKNMASRIDQIEIKEKPFEPKQVQIKVLEGIAIHQPILVDGYDITIRFGKHLVLQESRIQIENNKITWLKGDNGSGKTTLVDRIVKKDSAFVLAKNIKIGYFDQKMISLEPTLNLIETVQTTSSRDEQEIRNMLGNFLFRREDVYKKVEMLSGGELVRLSLAKIILSDINLLILDEPTNYLDIETKEVLQKALMAYGGAVLLISHDRAFAETIADVVYEIKDKQITCVL